MATHDARSDYYEVKGVVDVLTSVELRTAPRDNLLIRALESNEETARLLEAGREDPAFHFEVIVDYKGMARPALSDTLAADLRWQLLTYAWLRGRQPESYPVLAGILVFINELLPTADETRSFQRQVAATPPDTDVLPHGADATALQEWRRRDGTLVLSEEFRLRRALRVVPISDAAIQESLTQFDDTVARIEASVAAEAGGNPVVQAWDANPNEQMCAVCDWRSFCPQAPPHFRTPHTAP
jgi:hypothetical protein